MCCKKIYKINQIIHYLTINEEYNYLIYFNVFKYE